MLWLLTSNGFGFDGWFYDILKIYISLEKITDQKELEKVTQLSIIILIDDWILLRYV